MQKNITVLTKNEILSECKKIILKKNSESLVTLNSLMLKKAWHDKELRSAISNAVLITADSIGVSLASVILHRKRVYRYPGIEMMEDLIKDGWNVYFFGGEEGVAVKAADILLHKYPRANICGARSGFFSKAEENNIINSINNLKPDIVFVGMSLPEQEIWINRNKKRIKCGLIIGVGGSFDVLSGNLKRAPLIFKISGIEWLWRLLLQPWRISRIVMLPVFLVELIWKFFRGESLIN